MRMKIVAILCILIFLTGCKNSEVPLSNALALRSKILSSNGCSFQSKVIADYGEKIYTFSMNCETDKEGNLTFTVSKPDTIAGISGNITTNGGAITFDDQVLAFQTIADGQITPVTAPWILIKTLRSGYLNGCTQLENGYQISIDDSYEEDALRLNIWVKDEVPTSGEIFWQGRRILTVTVENFAFL